MTSSNKPVLSVFALSAAALFLGACSKDQPASQAPSASADETVKCFGINECKGESACNVNKPELGIEHSCAGENECKGKGWIKVPRSECEAKSGEIVG